MASVYTLPLKSPEEGATTIYKNVTVGTRNVQFRFQWAIASEEQYNIIMRYLDTKTKSDPLFVAGAYNYNYNYITFYVPFYEMTDEEITEYIEAGNPIPTSLLTKTTAVQIGVLRSRAEEAVLLSPIIHQYLETIRWQFRALYNGETTVGFVEPGGWYRSQDTDLQFRFVSPLAYIGKNDFNNVTIEFEVDNV